MEIDHIKLARIERDASRAEAIALRLREDAAEARRLAVHNLSFFTKRVCGLGRIKGIDMASLLSDMQALATQAEAAGYHDVAAEARVIHRYQMAAQSLQSDLSDAEKRSSALNSIARRCREFAATTANKSPHWQPVRTIINSGIF